MGGADGIYSDHRPRGDDASRNGDAFQHVTTAYVPSLGIFGFLQFLTHDIAPSDKRFYSLPHYDQRDTTLYIQIIFHHFTSFQYSFLRK
jgi:hypothetical protein